MIDFLISNGATIAVALVIAAAVVLVTVKLIRDRKRGKHCSCGECSGCAGCEKRAKNKDVQ